MLQKKQQQFNSSTRRLNFPAMNDASSATTTTSFLPCTSDVQGRAVAVEDFIQIPTLPSQHRLVLVLLTAFSSSHRLLQQDWTKLGFNFRAGYTLNIVPMIVGLVSLAWEI